MFELARTRFDRCIGRKRFPGRFELLSLPKPNFRRPQVSNTRYARYFFTASNSI